MTTTPRLGAPELPVGQNASETTINEDVRYIEQGAGFFIVLDKDLTAPPGSPAQADAYIVGPSATGAWSGHDDDIAFWLNTAWAFVTPIEGTRADVNDEDTAYRFDGTAWGMVTVSGALLAANDLSDVGNAASARTNLGATTAGANLFTIVNPGAVRFLRFNADNSVDALSASVFRTAIGAGTGSGDMVASNNLSDVSNAATSRTNLGATTAGGALFTLANPSAITFLRVNADNSVSALSASAFRTAIGAGTGTGSGDLVSTNNLSDVANAGTSRTNLGATTVGGAVFTLTNPSAITFLRVNADNSVSALSASAFRTAIGAGTGTGDLVAANNLSDVASAATARTNLGVDGYRIGLFFTTTPTASEVLALHVATDAFTLPANMASPNSKGACGTNPTSSFAVDVQRALAASPTSFSSIATITISTVGAFTFATASGTAKSIAAGDVIKVVAPGSADATCANVAITLRGTI